MGVPPFTPRAMKLSGLVDEGGMCGGPPRHPALLLLVPRAYPYPPMGIVSTGPPLQLSCTTALAPVETRSAPPVAQTLQEWELIA